MKSINRIDKSLADLAKGEKLKIGPIDADAPLRGSLTRLKTKLGSGAERRKVEVDRTLEALKSPALKVAMKEHPELGARVEAITAAAKKRAKEIDEEQAEQAEVLGRLAKDLDGFIETGALVEAVKGDSPRSKKETTAPPAGRRKK